VKWINNALLCCVWRGRLDYELSGEQEAQQWVVRCETPRFKCENGRGCGARIKTCDETPRTSSIGVVYTQGNSSMWSRGEHTHTTRSRAEKGRGTYCHTHCLKCHTQASLCIWRPEESCQVPGKSVPPDTACRICWTHTHSHTQRKVIDPVVQ